MKKNILTLVVYATTKKLKRRKLEKGKSYQEQVVGKQGN